MNADRAPTTVLAGARTAFGFLTRIPVGNTRVSVASAVPWFPVVGAAIGLMQGLVLVGVGHLTTTLLAAGTAVAASTLVTGAFHLDGMADMADAFGGGWTPQQRMEILKDSRLGTYGTATVVLVLMVETATLAAGLELAHLSDQVAGARSGSWLMPVTLTIAAHSWSRAAAVAVMGTAPTAGDGLGAGYAVEVGRSAVGAALTAGIAGLVPLVISLAAAVTHDTWAAVAVVVAAVAVSIAAAGIVVALARAKIGGVTGDVLGAVQQMAALSVLFVVAALA